MRLFVVLGWVLVSTSATALDKPKIPEPGVDLVLTGGKTSREFFAARMENPECRKTLEEKRVALDAEKQKLKTLQQEGEASAVEAQEKHTISARSSWIDAVSLCGPCTAQKTEKRVIQGTAAKEVWYISNGSCQVAEKSSSKLKSTFEKLRSSILHAKQYANKHGGFYFILDLIPYDIKTDKPLPEEDEIESSPMRGLISVRGPELLGFLTGFGYYAEQKFETREKDGLEEFFLEGGTIPTPSTIKFPVNVEDVLASGRTVNVSVSRVAGGVISQWFLNSDGYIRYFTAGDFRAELKYIEEQSRNIMLDTVINMAERAD